MTTPFTERSNALTAGIGSGASALGIVRALRAADAQLFSGFASAEKLVHVAKSNSDAIEPTISPQAKKEELCVGGRRLTFELAALSERIAFVLAKRQLQGLTHPYYDNVLIVMTGCGTSGRIAFHVARNFSAAFGGSDSRLSFRYLIAGGDASLLVSQELPEDDPVAGASDLQRAVDEFRGRGKTHVVLFGITCGLSAPYVLGQIEQLLAGNVLPEASDDDSTAVLIGFNPAAQARDVSVEGWQHTCRDVALMFETAAQAERAASVPPADRRRFLLNPSVGPEAVTGSSRMKGGSMTKLLLETVLAVALSDCSSLSPSATTTATTTEQLTTLGGATFPPRAAPTFADLGSSLFTRASAISKLMRTFAETATRTYWETESIAAAVAVVAHSLSHERGHVYYICGGDGTGPLGFIDASEMFDTYGEPADEVRGFVDGGWASLGNAEGDLKARGPLFRLGVDDFEECILPILTEHDVVVFPFVLPPDTSLESFATTSSRRWQLMVDGMSSAPSKRVALLVGGKRVPSTLRLAEFCDVPICVSLDDSAIGFALSNSILPTLYAEFSIKLVLNALTTGGCVLKGRVCGNYMINLGVSNNKLFHRSCKIISTIMKVSLDAAQHCLLRAIYDIDGKNIPANILNLPVSHHVITATPKVFVLPTALLLASHQFPTIDSARAALKEDPVVFRLVHKHSSVRLNSN